MGLGALLGSGGALIGGAGIKLFVDDAQYKAGLVKAEAEAKGSTSKIAGGFSALKAIGVAAFAALAVAAVKFAVDAIAAAREHEQALVQLENAIDGDTSALIAQASALQMVTGFSDEAIMSADTILSKFELTTNQMMELNPLLLDYARYSGFEATQAALNLGKALLGNAKATKSLGINFKATGNTTKDLNTLMGLLEEKVGGVSEAFASTSEGRAAILNEKMDEIKETVGAGLIPVIVALQDILISLAPTIGLVAKPIVFFLVGIAATIYLVEDAIAGLATLMDHLLGPLFDYDGTMSHLSSHTDEFNTALGMTSGAIEEQTGLVHEAGAVFLNYGQRAALARVQTTHFAHMTGDALDEWIANTKETFSTADDVWSNLSERAHVTAGDVIRAFNKQNRALANYEDNVKAVKDMGLEDDVVKSLGDMGIEGARILDGLARGSKEQIDKMNRTFETNASYAGHITNDLIGVGDAVKDLQGAQANVGVTVRYKVEGTLPPGVKP